MSAKSVVRITTEDTGRTYEFPDKDNPQIWGVQLKIDSVSTHGATNFSSYSTTRVIHVERETLENAGLLPMSEKDKECKDEPQETAEDLILRLLEHVGFYPVE